MHLLGHFYFLLSTFFVSPLWYTGRGWSAISYRPCYELLLLLHASECPMIWLSCSFISAFYMCLFTALQYSSFVQPPYFSWLSLLLILTCWYDSIAILMPITYYALIHLYCLADAEYWYRYINISTTKYSHVFYVLFAFYRFHLPPYLQVRSTTQFLIFNKYNLLSIIPDDFSLNFSNVLWEYRMANNKYLACK